MGGLLNAFAHCLLEVDPPTKISSQTPVSISCLDNHEDPFLAQGDQRDKGSRFWKIEKNLSDIYHTPLRPGDNFQLTPLRSLNAILVSSSVPIYQFKNVYLI